MATAAAVLGAGLHATTAVAKTPAPPAIGRTLEEASKYAAASGDPVEIADRTTETSQTFANADGSFTTKLSNQPVRARQGDTWRAVDTNLEFRSDGTVGPKVAVAQVTLSGGGSGLLARLGLKDGTFELKSPWSLPQPTLSGSTATYSDVIAGVDVVVEATAEGFSYNVVVKNRAAATSPALRSLHLPVTTSGLSLRSGRAGGPMYVAADGREVLSAGDGVMWDSAQPGPQTKLSGPPRPSAQIVDDGPSGAHSAEVEVRGDESGLTLVPDSELLTATSTVYPVVLDPVPATRSATAWAAAWQLYPTTSFYKTTHSLGVGFEDYEQHKIVRSFFQFDTSAFAGKKILDSTLRTYEVHSASCAARSVTVARTGAISAATTWNNQPAVQLTATSKSFANGYNSSCPDAYVEFPVTNSMVDTAAKGYTTSTFRLSATDETDGIAWKQFSSFGELQLHYLTPPDVPRRVGLTDPNEGCDNATAPVNVGSTNIQFGLTPVLKNNVNEPNARVQGELWIYSSSGNPFLTKLTGRDSPGTAMTVTIPSSALPDGVTYHFRARTLYPDDVSGVTLVSNWSVWCYFRVDRLAPDPPIVTAKFGATNIPNCQGESTCEEIASFGDVVSFTFKGAASDVSRHEYWFQGQQRTSVTGNTVTVALKPPQEGYNVLHVVSYDPAVHSSKPTDFMLNVGSGRPPIGSWSFDDGAGTIASDSASPAHPLIVYGGGAFDDAGRDGKSVLMDGVDDYAETSSPVVDTSLSFTVSAWARLTTAKEAVVVGAAGSVGSAFELYYSASSNRWVFQRMNTDTMSPGIVKALSDEPAVLGSWTHLTAVYDNVANKIQLYVNGRLQSAGNTSFPATSAWKASGPLSVGRGQYNGVRQYWFPGSIDGVQIWQRAFDATAAMALTDPRSGGAAVVSQAARWPMDTAVLGSDQVWRTPDTVFGANMPISGFGGSTDPAMSFVEDPDRGRVLQFSGAASEALSLPRSVVDAGTTFSAAAWVKLTDPTKPAVIARQAGTDRDAWRLEWKPIDSFGGQWIFSRARADGTGEDHAMFPDDIDSVTNSWRLVIGTYDANSPDGTNQGPLGGIGITVNKRADDLGTARHSSPYRLGSTVVGKGRVAGAEFAGEIDDFRLYVGPLVDDAVCREFPDLGSGTCPTPAG
ncbi:concanavalin A-like lectin/glucanase superfamily protein [Kribbella rubisoli]|uniref:Concanavalin A-like lectin/glucanase superfamily protein n=1 Tax=Kribbella rubisoli TaxID=3075929 RepID=A0A4Q7X0L6_9ACTN|nr:LamG-like jellyroll fold domain-containing protein [Kribbella rubisoli]RZU16407.1 concanavalin A-like lectin/glucanase superfamily protein [Kribbella rubisoli]